MANDQMWLDNGPDSFIAEVIQILRVQQLHIDIDISSRAPSRKVRIEFFADDQNGNFLRIVEFGHSYGEALKKVRDEIRKEIGK